MRNRSVISVASEFNGVRVLMTPTEPGAILWMAPDIHAAGCIHPDGLAEIWCGAQFTPYELIQSLRGAHQAMLATRVGLATAAGEG